MSEIKLPGAQPAQAPQQAELPIQAPEPVAVAEAVPVEQPQQPLVTPAPTIAPPRDGGDVAGEFLKGRQDSELEALMESAKANIAAQTTTKPVEEVPNKAEAEQVFSVGRDIVRGIVEGPKQVLGGARDAVQNTLFALDDLAGWMFKNSGLLDAENAVREALGVQTVTGDERVVPTLPEVGKAKSNTGALIRGASQFVSEFVPIMKALKTVSAPVSVMGKVAQVETGAAITSTLAFDPLEKRLSNLIEEFPDLSNPVTRYLQAQPDDTAAEGRFKNAIEGLGMGALTEGFAQGVRTIRANRIEKGLEPKTKLAQPEEGIIRQLGDPKAKKLVETKSAVTDSPDVALPAFLRGVDVDKLNYGNGLKELAEKAGVEVKQGKHRTTVIDEIKAKFPELAKAKQKAGLQGFRDTRGGAERFHGTSSEIADVQEFTYATGNIYGQGFYTTDAIDIAGGYQRKGGGSAPTVYKVTEKGSPAMFDLEQPTGEQFRQAVSDATGGSVNSFAWARDVLDETQTPRQWFDEIRLMSKGEGQSADTVQELFDSVQSNLTKLGFRGYRHVGGGNTSRAAHDVKIYWFPKDDIQLEKTDIAQFREVSPATDNADMLARFSRGETGELPFQMNWSKFTDSDDIDTAVNTVARMFKGQIDDARRGTIPDVELAEMARRLNMTPEDLLARNGGEAFNAEKILASKTILEASSTKLIDLAKVARTSTDEGDLFAFRKMLDIHAGLQKQFQGAASEAGRALRALQLPTGSKEKQLRDLQQMMMADGGPDRVRSMANAISSINDPAQIDRVVRDSIGKRLGDAAIEAWYFALLSGPQTHAVNVATSGLNALWQIPERALASQFAKLRGAGDSVQAGEATEMFYGMVGSLKDAIKASGRALITDEPSDIMGKTEARKYRAISSENLGMSGPEGSPAWFFNKALDGFGTFIRLPTRFLMGEDEFYRTIGKSMQVRSMALRQVKQEGLEGEAAAKRMQELVSDPTEEMMESAMDFSRSLTFTTPLGEAGQGIQKAMNKMPVSKFVLPFIRTPVNIMKYVGTRSPLSPMAQSIRQDIAKGGSEADLALSRMAMGSTLMLVSADMALNGQISGSGPTDPGLRRAWLETHQPNSIKVGDTWYSYNRADPFGMMMGIAADYAMIAGEVGEEDADKLITGAAIATSKNVFSKTWMRGPAELVEALNDPERFGDRFVQRFMGTLLVPTGVAQVARTIDPEWRDVQSILDSIKSRTPGFSDTLPARRNLWGEKIVSEGGLGPDIISPIYTKAVKKSPVDEYMVANKVEVSMPAKAQMGVELKPEEYWRFVELAGNGVKEPGTNMGAKETLEAIVAGEHSLSSQWQSATDGPEGGRALIIKSVIQGFRQAAQAKLLEEFPDLKLRVEDRALERGGALRETIMTPQRGRLQ